MKPWDAGTLMALLSVAAAVSALVAVLAFGACPGPPCTPEAQRQGLGWAFALLAGALALPSAAMLLAGLWRALRAALQGECA